MVVRDSWRDELEALIRLAAPVTAVQFGLLTLTAVDTIMLGHLSPDAMAAGALGYAVSWGIIIVPLGILYAVDPLVSQAWGAGDTARVGIVFERAIVLAVLLAIPTVAAVWLIGPFVAYLDQPAEIVPLVTTYLRALVPGTPALLVFVVARQTLQAMSIVKPAFVAILAANLVNILANYALVFGHFGFPALGVQGSGIATSLARTVSFLVVLVAGWKTLRPLFCGAWRTALSIRAQRPLLRLGLSIGLHQSLEFWVFSVTGVLVGTFGAVAFSGHQIAFSLSSLAFMLPMGIAGATSTRVGNAIGRGDRSAAQRIAVVGVALGVAVMTASATAFAVWPESLSRLYSPNSKVVAMGTVLLPIAAAFQFFDGIQVVLVGILRGLADTRVPAIIALFAFWVLGLPIGSFLAFTYASGPAGLWWGLTAGLAAVALLLMWRTKRQLSTPIEALVAARSEKNFLVKL